MTQRVLRGFTLVEMLVVLAIITIIVSVLLPVVAQIRGRARQTRCGSQLAQIARAGLLYAQDHDDRLPTCYRMPEPPYVVDQRVLLQPYLKNWDLFYCPERQTVMRECPDSGNDFRPNARCMGYGYNWGSGLGAGVGHLKADGLVRPWMWGPWVQEGVTLAEVKDSDRCFFFGDTNDYSFLTLLRDAMPGVRKGGDPTSMVNEVGQPYEPPRHHGGNNFVFVDGHVEWLRFPGGRWIDGGPWVVSDMSMYSRTGQWEAGPVP